jgi:GDP-4-dehydro-6-deoxy-D-mannose reductase
MRILVTGSQGFVGRQIEAAVRRICGDAVEIIHTARETEAVPGVDVLDITDRHSITRALDRHRPTHVLNLAGIAAPAAASADPDGAWRVNVDGVRLLARAILEHLPQTVLVNAGSGLVYGASFAARKPLDENALVAPLDDYGATKGAADLALGVLARRGLRCVRMRPFNHVGPGQTEAFAIPAFAAQIARIEAGLAPPVIRVGNLDAERDFLDVRCVAHSYALALRAGTELPSGVIINLASGVSRRIGDVLDMLLTMSRVPITVEADPQRLRPSDVPWVGGDTTRARSLLGWAPQVPFEATLSVVLEDWRRRISLRRADPGRASRHATGS